MSAFPQIRQLGFTLIELMIGVVVLAILLSVAIPNFQNWILNAQIRTAAESIRNGLQRARAEAIARNTNVEFDLLDNDDTCVNAATCSSWVVKLPIGTVIDSRASSEGSATVKRTTKSADGTANVTTATFNNFGLLTANSGVSAANAAATTLVDVHLDSTKLLPQDSRDLDVVITSPGGNVRMCDPGAPSKSLSGCP